MSVFRSAQRLINAGISAETLKVVMRYREFSTTERYYGATRQAQSGAIELVEKFSAKCTKSELVGGIDRTPRPTAEEVKKLKALLNSI